MRKKIKFSLIVICRIFFSILICSPLVTKANDKKGRILKIRFSKKYFLNQTSDNHDVVLCNLSKRKIGFYYYTKFFEMVEFYIQPKEKYSISLNTPVWITQLSDYQTPYYLTTENDTLNLDTDGKGIVNIMPEKNRTIVAQNEINTFAFISAQMPKKENEIYLEILRKNNYREMNNVIVDRYKNNMAFFLQYKTKHHLTEKFIALAENQILLNLYFYQCIFITGTIKHAIVEGSYKKYMDSVASNILSGSADISFGPPNFQVDYLLFIYKCKERLGHGYSDEQAYSIGLKEIKQKQVLDKVLFLIVKNKMNSDEQNIGSLALNFLSDCTDETYKNYINQLLNDKQVRASFTGHDDLLSKANAKVTFQEVLKNNLGKLIYIDTWASWCAPCREQMPASGRLRELYKNKAIEFVFISEDNTLRAWKAASEQEKLDKVKSNYFMVNFEKSDFKKKYNITTIPRYILIDKKGDLINVDALRPSDPKLKTLLDKLLEQ